MAKVFKGLADRYSNKETHMFKKPKLEVIEGAVEKNNIKVGKFALSSQPLTYQISVRLNNAANAFPSTSIAITELMNLLEKDEVYLGSVLTMRSVMPGHFQLAQMIQYFGKEKIKEVLTAVYGRYSV